MFEDLFEDRTESVVNRNAPGPATKQLKFIFSWGEKPYYLSKHITHGGNDVE